MAGISRLFHDPPYNTTLDLARARYAAMARRQCHAIERGSTTDRLDLAQSSDYREECPLGVAVSEMAGPRRPDDLRKSLADMSLQELVVLLPSHSLEDLSLDRDAHSAEELLSAWSTLFHPALLADAAKVPKWGRADKPPEEPAGSLIVVPPCSESRLPADWLAKAEAAGAVILRDHRHRPQMVTAALEQIEPGSAAVDPHLVADFLALGSCHLQVELLTRQLRYMSNLDEAEFQRKTIAAAEDAVAGKTDSARDQLRGAFDLLTEAREYFYPVETHLLDLTLVAHSTLGQPLRDELAAGGTRNLLISGELVRKMALEHPQTLAALKDALEKGTATIIGGEFEERELPLLSMEAILDQFRRGANSYDRYLDRRPTIFGRRRFGLSPLLPQMLQGVGFSGALHWTLDDGRFPTGNQSRIRWVGIGSASIEALARLPVDVTRPECFLALPETLGNAMDLDHAATAVFAHWPGQSSPWYEDLQRTSEYSGVLGRFVSADDYFEQTQYVGQSQRYMADRYRSPYLRQAVAQAAADPISRWVRYHGRRTAAEAVQALAAMADLLGGQGKVRAAGQDMIREVEDGDSTRSERQPELDQRLSSRLEEMVGRVSGFLPRTSAAAQRGYFLANPWSFSRRLCLDVSGLDRLPDCQGAVCAAAESAGRKQAVVEVPPMGFAWIGPGAETPPPPAKTPRKRRRAAKAEPPMVEENVLRNEFFEVTLDPITGAIRSLYDYTTRGNRLAQQIALRLPRSERPQQELSGDADSEMDYSVMAADDLSVTRSEPLVGEMVVRGRLMDRTGGRLARYVQRLRLQRRSRVLELEIDLEVDRPPGADPWDSYYAVRFAWGDATADLYRSVGLASRPSDAVRIEAPHFIELRGESTRTTILTGGLPYHRRFGLRKLDTLLLVRGEQTRSFRLGIGVDLACPVPAALDFLAPQAVVTETAPPPQSLSGWLFHLDSKNVVATHWEPLFSGDRAVGLRVRLLETEGRKRRTTLRSFRTIESAKKIDLQNKQLAELSVDGDGVAVEIGPHEWVQVELKLAP